MSPARRRSIPRRSSSSRSHARSTPLVALAFLGVFQLLSPGCAAERSAPEEFPPVDLGMSRQEVRGAVLNGDAAVQEESETSLAVVGRDRRVAEETFLFYNERLAAWTVRYAEAATRGNFQRLARRFELSYGEPDAMSDDGLVLQARWRMPEGNGRLLLSAFVGGPEGAAPLMIRVEDPAVVGRLIRDLNREQEEKLEEGS